MDYLQGTIEVARHSPLGLLQIIKRPDLQQFDATVVTVGGTNGKGSCVSVLESIFLAAGYRVASYTSPHLVQFNERIKLNGQSISDQKLLDAFREIDLARDDEVLNTFEFITLSALSVFKTFKPDIILLEVGLGGRCDPVNCVDADVTVITTVALDHINRLGGTREKIAKEKAEIMRQGKPVVLGEANMPRVLLDKAKQLNCDLYIHDKDFELVYEKDVCHWHGLHITYHNVPLTGLVSSNVACAMMVYHLLKDKLALSEADMVKGMQSLYLPGRFEFLTDNIIIDVAHNEQAISMLAHRLRQLPWKKTHAVVGVAKDKLQQSIFSEILDQINDWHVAAFGNERSAMAKELAQHLRGIGAETVVAYESIPAAYKKITNDLAANERVVIFGSFFTVAEVLQARE